MCNLWHTGIFIEELLCFDTNPCCSYVFEKQQCPQTLAEIFRNIGFCDGFRTMAACEKYPGSILLRHQVGFH